MKAVLSRALPMGWAAFLVAGSAPAQVDAQRFKPAVTHDGWVGAEGSGVRHPDDRWELAAVYGPGTQKAPPSYRIRLARLKMAWR